LAKALPAAGMLGLLAMMGCGSLNVGKKTISLVHDGQPAATIVIADEPLIIPGTTTDSGTHKPVPLTTAYAAGELQRFIEKATGAKLPIVTASQAPKAGPLVLVGRSRLTEKLGLKLPTRPEGLRIATCGRGVAILGEVAPKGTHEVVHEMDRGTLFGVYEFLERVVGYRFYFHFPADPELGLVTPSVKDVAVPGDYALDLSPDFPQRQAGFPTWEDPTAWLRCTREGAATGFFCNHTDEQWGQAYRKDHPEYFALRKDGTRHHASLCYSEPAVLTQRLANVEEYYTSGKWVGGWLAPSSKYVPFVPRDTAQEGCQCERCRNATRPERVKGRWGTVSNIIFQHGAGLATEVRRRWPQRRVSMLAYWDYTLPPDFELPDNLDVMVCQMWSGTMNKEPYWHERNVRLLKDWSAKVGGNRDRLYVWNYPCWPAFWTEAPLIFPHSLQQWLRDTYEISSGEFINPYGQDLQRQHYMCWMWHRLLWDRHADVDALLHDYCTSFYGPAGAPMEAFYKLLGDRYENVQWSRELPDSYIPVEQMYGETFSAGAVARLKGLLAAAGAACPKDPANLYTRRVAWMKSSMNAFFEEAGLAHKWLGHAPAHAAAKVTGVPDAAIWAKLPAALMSEGNFGREASPATAVRAAWDGQALYVQITAAEIAPLPPQESLSITVADQDPHSQLVWTIGADGNSLGGLRAKVIRDDREEAAWNVETAWTSAAEVSHEGDLKAEVIRNDRQDAAWIVEVKIAAEALGVEAGRAAPLSVQFGRVIEAVEANGKVRPRRVFAWSPPMGPPWSGKVRWGSLTLPAEQ
jgi:hypothetical protein